MKSGEAEDWSGQACMNLHMFSACEGCSGRRIFGCLALEQWCALPWARGIWWQFAIASL